MTGEPHLAGQTVVVIGGSSGIGLETARLAGQEGAAVIITGRHADRLKQAAVDVGARDTAVFDATDQAALSGFFGGLPGPVDHVMVTGPGPYYAPLAELEHDKAHADFDHHVWLAVSVAQQAVGRVRPGGTLLFMTGSGESRGPGLSLMAAATAALPATLPIRRVVEPADVAALAVHLMINTAITGATCAIDGGQQLLPGGLRGARPASRHHHRRIPGHRCRPRGRLPRAWLGGGGQRAQDQAVGSR